MFFFFFLSICWFRNHFQIIIVSPLPHFAYLYVNLEMESRISLDGVTPKWRKEIFASL